MYSKLIFLELIRKLDLLAPFSEIDFQSMSKPDYFEDC